MKNTILGLVALLFLNTAIADDAAKKQEMMKAWEAFATPSDGHKVLSSMAGKWKYTSKWWETENSKPQESGGTSTLKMILGGRYLQNETKGKAMGMPFEGLGLMGYNNLEKKYESMWLDNMGTGMMQGTGSYDASTQILKDSGEYSCPMSNKKRDYRSEWKIIDKNNMTYTMWGPGMDGGKEIKQMEMVFKRAK